MTKSPTATMRPRRAPPCQVSAVRHGVARGIVVVCLVILGAARLVAEPPLHEPPLHEPPLHEPASPVGANHDVGRQELAAPAPSELFDRNWPAFRGPSGSGVSAYADQPTTWSDRTAEGIVWKTKTPLPGTNSPIVWNDRIFISGATKERRDVFCFAADSGTILWRREVSPRLTIAEKPASGQPLKVNRDTGYAAPTMATDGQRAYAVFANGDLAAFDFSGHEVWSRSLGIPKNNYGHASSLATFNDTLFVQYDQGATDDGLSKLYALDGATGQTRWQVKRNVPASWSSPIVLRDLPQPLVITCSDPWVIAYSPTSGEEIWRANCLEPAEVGTSPIHSQGMIFATNDYATVSAIRADGRGDVTATHIAWSADEGLPDICSPLATERFLLLLGSGGILTCYDKKVGGKPLWEEDFKAEFASSPSLVGNHVYLFSREGVTWIVEPTPEGCKRISECDLGEPVVTSPAFQDGRIYIRGAQHLFAIGAK